MRMMQSVRTVLGLFWNNEGYGLQSPDIIHNNQV
jgi:hypothetical protein